MLNSAYVQANQAEFHAAIRAGTRAARALFADCESSPSLDAHDLNEEGRVREPDFPEPNEAIAPVSPRQTDA